MLDEYIDSKKEEIIEEVSALVKIPSVHEESLDHTKPFGTEASNALEHFLELGSRLGFKVKNVDGYCGYVEFGEGEELLGIVGHLDVVPVGDGWTFEPFNPKIADGKLYGRGTTDDKGPVVASLYAMKAVMDTCNVNKRVRLIVGLNEERDWKCIKYYKEHEEMPTLGFSPDADFPCIYAEKGLMSIYVSSENKDDAIEILDIDYRNNAINVVPKYCSMKIKLKQREERTTDVVRSIKKVASENNFNINVQEDNLIIFIESFGKASHAAYPELGENAIQRLIYTLYYALDESRIHSSIIDTLFNKFKLEIYGESINADVEDEMGRLTSNVAKLYLDENKITIASNLRVPVTYRIENIESRILDSFSDTEWNVEFTDEKDSLYIPKENELVQKLCRIYNEFYGRDEEPISIGGATYARAFKNCVSFGAMMPNEEDMCHKADEYIKIDNLINASKIYARAIYELTR